MAPKPIPRKALQEALNAVSAAGGNVTVAAMRLKMSRSGLQNRLRLAHMHNMASEVEQGPALRLTPNGTEIASVTAAVAALLRRAPLSIEEAARRTRSLPSQVEDAIAEIRQQGYNVSKLGDRFVIAAPINPAFTLQGELPTYYSRPDGTYLFGACGDNHLGSKYSRLDVLNELYDWYADEGVDRVFNTGNWIDGERRFNAHDLIAHGMDGQLRYLAGHYPQRDGITTYAVAGDDHEGWYAQDLGIDVGVRAEQTMRDAGRSDWVNLGYMEAHVRLVHSQTGAEAILAVVHPGGGSSYAVSYSIQKIIESLDGGEKPAVGLYGHYHKLWAGNIRNVWCIQTGTTEDQTPFMRKKKLEAHVGGFMVKLTQDPKTGAIVRCRPEMARYFARGFYNNRWSHGGDVQHVRRKR